MIEDSLEVQPEEPCKESLGAQVLLGSENNGRWLKKEVRQQNHCSGGTGWVALAARVDRVQDRSSIRDDANKLNRLQTVGPDFRWLEHNLAMPRSLSVSKGGPQPEGNEVSFKLLYYGKCKRGDVREVHD
jgi:hypothetical protein